MELKKISPRPVTNGPETLLCPWLFRICAGVGAFPLSIVTHNAKQSLQVTLALKRYSLFITLMSFATLAFLLTLTLTYRGVMNFVSSMVLSAKSASAVQY